MLLVGPTGAASAAGPPCPADSTYNKDTRMCEAPPTPECAAGFTLDANGVCTRATTQGCPAGSYLSGGLCVGPQPSIFCTSGTYDAQADACRSFRCSGFSCGTVWSSATHVCATGFTYNSFRRQCVRPTQAICTEGALNTSTGQCEFAATPTCAAGFSLSTDSGAAVCQAAPLRGGGSDAHGAGNACPDAAPNRTGTPPNCGNGRGGSV